jgi:iron complex outermembrane receptor protein
MLSKFKTTIFSGCGVAALVAGLATSMSAPAQAQTAASSGQTEQVIVTGTRQQGRTVETSPSPIDVVGSAQIADSGTTNIFDSLNALLPSFEIPATGGDLSRLVRSARLRGLSPDETLVLVDGKRRHVSASINADVGPVGGSDPADLDLISPSMIDHIEVLRDGAAAQYGSDAIAGVINIITKKGTDGGSIYTQNGAYFPGKGQSSDGYSFAGGGNYGLALGSAGYIDLSADYRTHDHSNRCGLDPRIAAFGITQNPCKTAGDPASHTLTLGTSAGYDFDGVNAYFMGTFADRTSAGYTGWRKPNRYASPWYQANYPNGFVPAEGIDENDYSVTGGIKSDSDATWTWDLSGTYGTDLIDIANIGDLNPNLITNTGYLVNPVPYKTYAGSFNDSELIINLDISRNFETGLFATPVTLSFGGEYRHNNYKILPGEFNSYSGAGASAFPGIAPSNATNVSRDNKAIYVDAATNLVENWQVDIAGRYEHYSDVGDTVTGKITTRYDFSPRFGIRGTVSNGFRAPTLAQEFQTQLNVGPTAASGQLPATSAAAVALGAVPLRPEYSQNYTVGLTAEPLAGLHLAIDVYQINIHSQVANSGLIGAAQATNPVLYNTVVAALAQAGFTIAPGVTQAFAQFYTNGLSTRTRGVDLTAEYRSDGPWDGTIDWSLSGNFNDVGLTHISTFANGSTEFTPDVLSEINADAPKNKFILQATYNVDRWGITLRETRWGTTEEVMPDQSKGPPTYYTNVITPKYLTDVQIGYNITDALKVSAGALNLFNQYPNQGVFGTRDTDNAHVYPGNSPFGFNGGTYYFRVDYKL